jgi:outer membrane protein TolC
MRHIILIKILLLQLFFCHTALGTYPVGVESIVKEVLENSREIKSLNNTLLSKEDLTEAEKKYFYPKVDFVVEYNDFYGKLDPTLEEDAELTLSLTSKLYSTVSKDKISTADNNRLSAFYKLKDKESELYFTVLTQLINIERSRMFLQESDAIREQMNDYISQISNAVYAGISPRSYLRETQLIKFRFDDVVATVESDIDNFFTQLSLSTGYNVINKNDIGLDTTFLKLIFSEKINFDAQMAVSNNLTLLSKYHEVEGLKYSAGSQFEKFKITAFNDTDIGLKSNDTNESRDVREDSAAGIRIEYKMFDIQRAKTQSASYKIYLSEIELLDNEREKIFVQVQQLSEQYATTTKKRGSLLEQIELSKSLIETQEREILIDRIEFIDMVQSLSELVQTHVTLLNNDVQLYDTILSYKNLIAQRFN